MNPNGANLLLDELSAKEQVIRDNEERIAELTAENTRIREKNKAMADYCGKANSKLKQYQSAMEEVSQLRCVVRSMIKQEQGLE